MSQYSDSKLASPLLIVIMLLQELFDAHGPSANSTSTVGNPLISVRFVNTRCRGCTHKSRTKPRVTEAMTQPSQMNRTRNGHTWLLMEHAVAEY